MADEDKIIDEIATEEAQETLDAIKDLETIEQEVVEEAEASVELQDKIGDEEASVAAAETAFDFKEAEKDTEDLERELEA